MAEIQNIKKAVENSGRSLNELAYEYKVSVPTLYKAMAGKNSFQPRVRRQLEKLVTDFKPA